MCSKINEVRYLSYKMGRVGDLKVGSYAIVNGEPSRIVSLQKSKPGKHGSSKFRCTAVSLFDGSKRTFVSPVDTSIHIPIVEKRSGQIVSMTPTTLQLMDLETYDLYDIPIFPRLEPFTEGTEIPGFFLEDEFYLIDIPLEVDME